MTAMNKSTSSPEGGGAMTCVDFEVSKVDVRDFRFREKSDYRRNALPTILMGGQQQFSSGIPELDARFCGVGTDVEQARQILRGVSVVESLIALPPGADIHVKGGRCYVTADGFPNDVDFADRLFAASEQLLASLDSDAV